MLLDDFSEVEKAMEQMSLAAGSANDEMSIVMESLDFKINRFKETWVGIWQNLIDRGTVGAIVDFGSKVANVIGLITEKIGLLGTAISGITLFNLVKNFGKPKSRVSVKWAEGISVLGDSPVFLCAA